MLRKISLRKMFVLTVITLGLYQIYWLARSRNEIVKKYTVRLPHWLWLIVPGVIMLSLIFPVAILVYGASLSLEQTVAILMGFMLLAYIVSYGISIWWIWKYGRKAEKLTQGRFPAGWILLYWILLTPVTIFILQNYFNRSPKIKDLKAPSKYEPTSKFVLRSIIAVTIALLISAASYFVFPLTEDWNTVRSEGRELDAMYHESERLLGRYDECVDKLETKFPGDVTADNEAAYTAEYDTCERIRVDQNAAIDDYNAALDKW